MTVTDSTGQLQRGIAIARDGHRLLAQIHLRQAAEESPRDPRVWLWMAWLAESPAAMVHCLTRVLAEQPENVLAQDGLRWARGLAQLDAGDARGAPFDNQPAAADFAWTTVVDASAAVPEACETQATATLGAAIAAVDQLVLDDVALPVDENRRSELLPQPAAATPPDASGAPTPSASTPFSAFWKHPSRPAPATGTLSTPAAPVPAAKAKSDSEPSDVEATVPSVATEVFSAGKQSSTAVVELDQPATPAGESIWESTPPVAVAPPQEVVVEATVVVQETCAAPGGPNILVVDDSPTVRKLVTMTLSKHGYRVFSADDGVAAIEAMKACQPALIIMDITMPRLDGYKLCKLVRNHETTKDVKVVMLSGKDGMFDKFRGRMAGCTDYLTKPFSPQTLLATVEKFVGAPVA